MVVIHFDNDCEAEGMNLDMPDYNDSVNLVIKQEDREVIEMYMTHELAEQICEALQKALKP